MKLDELARTSAEAARTSVRTLEPPPIGERPPIRAWAPVLAGAAVTALAVGGLVVMDRGDDGTDPVAAPPSVPDEVAVPRLGLAPDDRWVAVFATDGPELGEVPTQRFDYYGDPTATRPFADDDLVIAWGGIMEEPDGDPVVVRGVTGALTSGDVAGLGTDVLTLAWSEPDGTSILLASRHADADRLVAIADGLVVDPVVGTVTPDPSIGLARVAADAGTPFMATRGDVNGSVVAYQATDVEDLSLVITSRRGSLDQPLVSAEWWLGAPAEVALTAGTGYEFDFSELFGGQAGTGRLLFWEPVRGVTAQIVVSGPEIDLDLAAIVESVTELDEATWSALLEAASAPQPDTGSLDAVYGEGDGRIEGEPFAWSFGEQDGQLCFNFSTGPGGSSSCQELPTSLGTEPAVIVDQGTTDDRFGYWLIAADPSVDAIVDVETGLILERFDADPFSWFVAVAPAGQEPSFVVRVDGEVVAEVATGFAVEEPAVTSATAPAVDEG